MERRTRDAYNQWAQDYDSDPNPQTALEEAHVLRSLNPQPGERILDAGCGTGRYIGTIMRYGAQPVGIDFSEGMLAVARARFPDTPFLRGDLRARLPFPDAVFDKVLCAQALKHLPGLAYAVTEFARSLKPGGVLIASVTHPCMDWCGYEMVERPSFVLSNESDVYQHQQADYERAFRDGGLDFELIPVAIDESIRKFLTEESFHRVRGREQVAIFRGVKRPTA